MPWISCTLIDDYGRTTKRRYEVETQTLLTDYATVAATFATSLQGVSDLGLVRADLIIEGITSGHAVTAGANVDVGATFSGYIANGDGKKASHKIPGFKDSLVDADGSIDLSGATATYLAHFLTAGDFMLSDGETISDWIKGTLDR